MNLLKQLFSMALSTSDQNLTRSTTTKAHFRTTDVFFFQKPNASTSDFIVYHGPLRLTTVAMDVQDII